jgi:hypothetical protein
LDCIAQGKWVESFHRFTNLILLQLGQQINPRRFTETLVAGDLGVAPMLQNPPSSLFLPARGTPAGTLLLRSAFPQSKGGSDVPVLAQWQESWPIFSAKAGGSNLRMEN